MSDTTIIAIENILDNFASINPKMKNLFIILNTKNEVALAEKTKTPIGSKIISNFMSYNSMRGFLINFNLSSR